MSSEHKQWNLGTWVKLGRAPFHAVGALPFILGSLLAWRLGHAFSMPVFVLGLLAVVLVMLTTYLNGELFDIEEDRISRAASANPFSGGSGVMVLGLVRPATVKAVSVASAAAACAIGAVLQFGLRTGNWTIPLGLSGLAAGALYSAPPVRFVSRGLGEALIAYGYGWLALATGYYLQTGALPGTIHRVAPAIAFTIFNVILINEFPDNEADRATGKRNIPVRLGLRRSAYLYVAASVGGVASSLFALWKLFPPLALGAYAPVAALSAAAAVGVAAGGYRHRPMLVALCGVTLLVNICTALVFIAGAAAMGRD